MAIQQRKITDAQILQHGVCAAPDKLEQSTAENKSIFDRLVKNVVQGAHNSLIDDLAGAGGAGNIGTTGGGSVQGHIDSKSNPHKVTKTDVGLPNVDNTADINKPISNAQAAVNAQKADKADTFTKAQTLSQIDQKVVDIGSSDMAQAVYDPNHRRQDIFSTFSNNNLLINSNFEKAVNQRAETSKQTAGFFIDRWFYTGGGSVTIANQGLILDSTGTDYVRVLQPFEAAIPSGKKVTISWSDGDNVYEATGAVSYDSTKPVYLAEASKPGVTQYVRCATENNKFRVEMVCIGLVTIKWIKLEYSSVATPFVPRSYGEELALCQRYSIKVGEFMRIRASYIGGNEIDFPLPIPTTMRIIPTMIGEPIVNTLNATSVSGFTYSLINSTAGYVIIRVTKPAHGQTDALVNPNNILLDAEIY